MTLFRINVAINPSFWKGVLEFGCRYCPDQTWSDWRSDICRNATVEVGEQHFAGWSIYCWGRYLSTKILFTRTICAHTAVNWTILNYKLSSARGMIENALGILGSRFKIFGTVNFPLLARTFILAEFYTTGYDVPL